MFFRTSLRLFVYVLFPFVASQLEQPHRLDLIVRRDEARKRRPLIPIFEEDLKEEVRVTPRCASWAHVINLIL